MFKQHNPDSQQKDRDNPNEQNIRKQVLMVNNSKISAFLMVNKSLQRHVDGSLPHLKKSYLLQPKLSSPFSKEIKTSNSKEHY